MAFRFDLPRLLNIIWDHDETMDRTHLTSLIYKRNMVIYLSIKEGIMKTGKIIIIVAIMFLAYAPTRIRPAPYG